jgi:CoA:oxalate CoA-transferase
MAGRKIIGPLAGIRVVDLTRILAGPFATMVLADLGAEVIKVENPHLGDDSRAYGPFIRGESAYFMSLNRNKKSITLNLHHPKGKQTLRELVKLSDVLVENFRPDTMEKLDLGYDSLKKTNPRLVYASCSGFGSTGSYSKKPAYDITIQALGGIMSLTGEPGGRPVRVGTSIGDIAAGLFTAIGIISAIHARERTGCGQKIDLSMLDCQVAILENAIARYFVTGEVPGPLETRHPSITPFEQFRSKDSYIVIAAGNDALWAKLSGALGKPELLDDSRFKDNNLRTENQPQLRSIIEEITATKTTQEWIEIFEREGVPCAPVNTVADVVKHPQVLARNMLAELIHPTAGRIMMPNLPIRLSNTPGGVQRPPPLHGEHTEEVLSELLGLSTQEIGHMRSENAI